MKGELDSFVTRHSSLVIRHSSLVIRHSSFVTRHSSFYRCSCRTRRTMLNAEARVRIAQKEQIAPYPFVSKSVPETQAASPIPICEKEFFRATKEPRCVA